MLCEEHTWRSGIKKYYGPSLCSKWWQLAAAVHCVAVGLKPAYLLDILTPDPSLFCSLLNYVLSEQQQSSHKLRAAVVTKWQKEMRVVGIGSDVLVVNTTAIRDLFRSSSCVYVDVGRTEGSSDCSDTHIHIQHCSEIKDKCREWYSEFCTTEQSQTVGSSTSRDSSAGVRLLSVALPPEVNMCTLFGRLLGYPVVYWFNITAGYSLDFVDLVNYQVTVSNAGHDQGEYASLMGHQLYSFSVPRCVESATRDAVCVWFQRLAERAVMLGLELDQTCTVLSLPSVVL